MGHAEARPNAKTTVELSWEGHAKGPPIPAITTVELSWEGRATQ